MTDLTKRLQYALLTDAGPEKVRALMVELAIPSGGSGGSINDVRRSVLYPCSDIAVLRNSFANIGITGGGGDARAALSDIREAILRDVTGPEAILRRGLNALLAPGDLAGGGTIPSTTSIASSNNPATAGASITFTATITTTGATPTGTVTFYDGVVAIGTGTVSGTTATFATSALSGGTHSMTARYGGDGTHQASTSSALSQVVNMIVTSIVMTASPEPSASAASVTLTATVTPPTATGTVTFTDLTSAAGFLTTEAGDDLITDTGDLLTS